MKFQIKSRWDNKVLFEAEIDKDVSQDSRIKVALEIAVKLRANLRGANLWSANLWDANLRDADLEGANLRGAKLRDADLEGAGLWGANLWSANLRDADLRDADLEGAGLWGANLEGANLGGANLRGANLRDANLRGANLWSANLWGANLEGANLEGAKLGGRSIVPEEGSFVAWKKCEREIIAKLQIPANAKRTSSLVGRKCRAEKVKTLALYGKDGKDLGPQASAKNGRFGGSASKPTTYTVGKITRAETFDDDIRIECSGGIHFFITREEAESWS